MIRVLISAEIEKLNAALKNMGYGNKQAIHTEPLIRREEPYRYFQPNERRAIFSKLFYFTIGCDIKYKSFVYRKAEHENIFKLFKERVEEGFFERNTKERIYIENLHNRRQ